MRLSRQLALVALLLPSLAARGDDVITEVMSPIASFQFAENVSEAALSNGGLTSPFVSYHYAEDFSNDVLASGGVISPLVGFQYLENFSITALGNGGILSPLVSYHYFEWPGDDVLRLQRSPLVSYFYHGNAGTQIALRGRVTAANGSPVAAATISIAFGNLPLTATASDANGYYSVPLDAGIYAVTVSAPGYAKSSRALTLSAGTASQNFQLATLPSVPNQTLVNRQPATFTFPPIGSLGERLKVFDGTAFVDVAPANAPSPAKMTIVLTHGWIPQALGYELPDSGVEGWPTTMARAMKAQGVTGDVANIVAWDWRYAAQGTLPPEENIPGEGVLLGRSLQTQLGSGYSQPIHFIGHSLGTMVNAAAGNFLHGDRTAQQEVTANPWLSAPMHFTLFDQAEISRIASAQVLFDGVTLALKNEDGIPLLSAAKYAAKTLHGWKPSLPVRYDWADNYISAFGFYQPNTLNVALQKAEGIAALRAASETSNPLILPLKTIAYAHSYPIDWYGLSVGNPTYSGNALGFKRSYEYARLSGADSSFPPPISELSPGDAYHQTPASSEQLALEPLPLQNVAQLIVPLFGNGADAIVQAVLGPIQIVGEVSSEIRDAATQASEWVTQGFNYVGNAAMQGGQSVVNLYNSAVLRLRLHTSSPASFAGVQRSTFSKDASVSDAAPMAWLSVQFPAGATAMAFDFTVEGSPSNDVLVCGIGTNNLFWLEAKYVPTNVMSASRLIDVSTWAGTTNELFFGLVGGTSTNATLVIENIRFYLLAAPKLEIAVNGNVTSLTWPATAGGYVVETTSTLTAPTWETLTNTPVILADRYVLTNSLGNGSQFFRLKKN